MQIAATGLIAAVLSAVLALAPGAAPADEALRMEDRNFLLSAMAESVKQARVGRLAAGKATDPEVREFAQAMVDHHEAAHARLADAARRLGVEPLTEIDPVAARWTATLEALAGPAFDAVYANGQEIELYAATYVYQRGDRFASDSGLRQEAGREAEANDAHRRTAQRLAARLEPAPTAPLHVEDGSFLVFAMEVDRSQVQLGELAAERAQDPRVREFARHMVEAHGASSEQHARLAQANGIAPLDVVGPVARRVREHLQGLPGPVFDREYMVAQVASHDHWFYRFEREAISGLDGEVREVSAKGARDGKGHHDMARQVVDGLR